MLGNLLRTTKEQTRSSLSDLTVLSSSNDPYRLDTPANHVKGRWFREQMERCGLLASVACIHNRGIHNAANEHLAALREKLDAIELATDGLDLDLPPVAIPAPRLEADGVAPLVSSDMHLADAIRVLRGRKDYKGGAL